MSPRRYQKSDKEHTRKRRAEVSDTEDWRRADSYVPLSSNAVVQLQRTIGNRAVQRLISSEKLHGAGIVQRDSGGQEAASTPILATLTFDRIGKLKGNSRVAGHEGKIEILSLHRDVEKPSRIRDAPTTTNIEITRNVDDLSPLFARANVDGDPIKTAQFEFTRRNDAGEVEIAHSVEFSNGLISSYQLSGGGEQQAESIGIQFKSNEA